MKRTAHVLSLAVLAFALVACGDGGGGNNEAFCGDLESLNNQIADGDLDGDINAVLATVNSMIEETASAGARLDAAKAVGQAIKRGDRGNDLFDVIDEQFGDFGEDCDVELAAPPDVTAPPDDDTTTTSDPDDTTTTTGPVETGDTVPDGLAAQLIEAREPVPAEVDTEDVDDDDDLRGLADSCFNGDFAACDELFTVTGIDTVGESYGDTCGGRIADGGGFDFLCTSMFFGPTDPAAFVSSDGSAPQAGSETLIQDCFAGGMASCDSLFVDFTIPSFETDYGFVCGGRILFENRLGNAAGCVDIFGDVAFQ